MIFFEINELIKLTRENLPKGIDASFSMFPMHQFLCITLVMSHAISTSDVPKNPAVRREWVNFQLRLRGRSLRSLALAEGVSAQAMSAALMTPNSHLEPVIAAALGILPRDLFPERFNAAGERIARIRPIQRSTRRIGRNVESGGAA